MPDTIFVTALGLHFLLLPMLAHAEQQVVEIGTIAQSAKVLKHSTPLDAKVSLRMKRVPLRAYLNEVGRQSKLHFNFVSGVESCAVTAFLKNVTARDALQITLNIEGIAYQQLGRSDTYTIVPRMDMKICPTDPPMSRPYSTCKHTTGPGINVSCVSAMLSDYAETIYGLSGANFFFPNGAEFQPITTDLYKSDLAQAVHAIEKLDSVTISQFGPSNIYVVTAKAR